jgi:hypothetical protein
LMPWNSVGRFVAENEADATSVGHTIQPCPAADGDCRILS